MHPRSFYKLLTAAVIAFAAALSVWILTPEYSAGTFFGQPLIPGLMEKSTTSKPFPLNTAVKQ